ncbi:MAG: hypothetical protein QXV69_07860 [Sulfolobaceae archaeon]
MKRRIILLGINGLSYSRFSSCKPKFLLNLFNIVYRGVTYNKKPQDHAKSWLSIIEMTESQNEKELKLLRETESIAINIPISDPTYGEVRFNYNEVKLEEEVRKVIEAILSKIDEAPIIASIIGLDRVLHLGVNSTEEICRLYSLIDDFIRKIVNVVDDFIIFSPFGEPLSPNEYDHEEYGVYLATIPRPSERSTIKLPEIGILYKKLILMEK